MCVFPKCFRDSPLAVSLTVTLADREFLIVVIANPDFTTYVPQHPAGDTELGLGIALTVIVLLMVWIASWCWLQQDRKRDQYAQQELERSTIKAARDTNNRIVGYICHELRNPLHVLETWFDLFFSNFGKSSTPVGKHTPHSSSLQSVTSPAASVASGDANNPFSHLSHDDLVTASQDISNALAQMRCIVNDVLDYRAVSAWCARRSGRLHFGLSHSMLS
jgi:signal transduction histidine kinase